MLSTLSTIDRLVARTAPLWVWVGQLGLVAVGVHFAADHLDEPVASGLASLGLPWPDPQTPVVVALYLALIAEGLTLLWAARSLARTVGQPLIAGPREWRARWSAHNVSAPLLWLVFSASGAWAIAMTVEDAAAALGARPAAALGWGAAALIVARFGVGSARRLVRQAPPPRRRTDGLRWLPLLVVMGGLAVRHGLPIWGPLGGAS